MQPMLSAEQEFKQRKNCRCLACHQSSLSWKLLYWARIMLVYGHARGLLWTPPSNSACSLPGMSIQSITITSDKKLRLNRPSYTCGQYNPYNPWHDWLTTVVFVMETINHRRLSQRFLHEISPNENLYCSHCCTGALFWLCSFNLSVLVI